MPPKSTESAITEATKDTAFLAACFMNLKSKPQVDSVAVAAQLSMSAGGVKNKLRPILKAMEEAGALWTNDAVTSTPSRGGGGKAKSKTTGSEAKNDADAEGVDSADPVTLKSSSKAPRTPRTAATGSITKRGRKAKDADTDGEEGKGKTPAARKKAKINPATVTEEQDQSDEQIKTEHEVDGSAEEGVEAEEGGAVQQVKSETNIE